IAKCIGRLAVTLVTQITVVEDNGATETVTAANALVKSDINNWYIVVGQAYDALNVNQLSENIETIFDNIANTPKFDAGKLGELFRAGSDEDRDFLTRKEFGTLAVLDLADNTDHRAKCFADTAGRFIGNCASQIDLNDYDIDLRDPGADTNMPAIVRLFKDLGIDIDDFNGG
ncbi:MAG: hypothetical protein K2O10_05165, partial [Muribaculaceae bacterium]|nr:hypothetical protein [Muribaculaceae bacterium]